VRVLRLELLRDLAASFRTEDLFSRNPAIFVHKIEPAPHDIDAVVHSISLVVSDIVK